MRDALVMPADGGLEESISLADLFLQASRSMAQSDARLYRSVDRHLTRTREILRQAEAQAHGFPVDTGFPLDTTAVSTPLLTGAPSFERQTRKSLEALCRQHGVRGYARLSKATMIQRLQELGVAPPPVPMEALSKAELLSLLRDLLRTREHDG